MQVALWVGFHLFVLAVLAVDLGLASRKPHAVTMKEAGAWTAVWVSLSLLLCAGFWHFSGSAVALQWLTAYVIEYALSVDNLFVFLMVFSYFRVDAEHRHRVLFWGVMGAFFMRATLILLGTALVHRFHWLLYVFGAFLIYTAAKMMFAKEDADEDPEQRWIVRQSRRVLPMAQHPEKAPAGTFLVREEGRLKVTPLFLVLLVVEATDLLFALDSIPAVLGISQDAFVVYTSNVCAILGLRSLFFLVAGLMDKFHFLKVGLALILAFVGGKMLVTVVDVHVPIGLSLGIIAAVLVGSVVASLVWPKAPEPGQDQGSART